METEVVHINKDDYDVLIDRTTMWGNPFIIGIDGSRNEVIIKFDQWLDGIILQDYKQKERQDILDNIKQLRGQRLGCWCKPKPCHGEILARRADGEIHL